MRNVFGVILLCCCLAHAGDRPTGNPETLAERSQAQARKVLDRAVQAIGGEEALRSIESVRLRAQGETWPRLQMSTPAPPFEGGTLAETLLLDLKNNRLLLEQRGNGQGFEGHNAVLIRAGEEGANYDHRARTITPIPVAQSTQQQFVQYYRRLPNLLLLEALNRETTLRYLGTERFEGKPHEVFTFVMADGQQVAVAVDSASGLLSKYELVYIDPLLGEESSEVLFGNYESAGKLRVPRSWTHRIAGEVNLRYEDFSVEINPQLGADAFEVAAEGYTRVDPLTDAQAAEVEKLAEGVFVIRNVAAPNYNTLAVEFKDHVLAVEAPMSGAGADAVIARIEELFPGKPIRYVAVTHHHADHIGGLRSFIAEGATVITTAGNKEVVAAMAAAPQTDRLARQPRKPALMLVEGGKRVLSDGSRTVELIDVGPNPHAKEMLVAWLPQERILFQGDLFFVPANGAPVGPPQPTTISFARRLPALGLNVERIVGVHGRTATFEEFEAATREFL